MAYRLSPCLRSAHISTPYLVPLPSPKVAATIAGTRYPYLKVGVPVVPSVFALPPRWYQKGTGFYNTLFFMVFSGTTLAGTKKVPVVPSRYPNTCFKRPFGYRDFWLKLINF